MKRCPSCGRKNYNNESYCPICNYYLGKIREEPNTTTFKQEVYIECPYCKSNNVYKIGIISRALSIGAFGFASGKIGKQWHCKECNSDF